MTRSVNNLQKAHTNFWRST